MWIELSEAAKSGLVWIEPSAAFDEEEGSVHGEHSVHERTQFCSTNNFSDHVVARRYYPTS